MGEDTETVFSVTEFDTNRPRVFATEEWALSFARGEKQYAESVCGLFAEMGADDEASYAEELLEGGFVEAEGWVHPSQTDAGTYAGILAAGPGGTHWRDV